MNPSLTFTSPPARGRTTHGSIRSSAANGSAWLDKPRHFTISLLLEKLEVRGVATPLYARPRWEDELAGIVLPPMWQSPLVAVFVFTTDKSRHIVPAGYQTNWVTVAPPLEEKK